MGSKQISFIQVYAIILVCIGHSFTAVDSMYLHKWIYVFHMPLFMFISGYLLNYTTNKKGLLINQINLWGQNGYIWKKIKRLLIPYFIISSITFFPKALLSAHALRPVELNWESYIHMLIYPNDNVIKFFWFLPTLFIVSILFVCLYKLLANKNNGLHTTKIIILVSALFFLYIWNPLSSIEIFNLKSCFVYLLYFSFGVFLPNIKHIIKILHTTSVFTFIVLFITFSALVYWGDSGNKIMSIIYVITGITLTYSISSLYINHQCHFLDHLYGSSYAIYLFSWYPLTFMQAFILNKINIHWSIIAIASTILQIYLPYILYRIILYIEKKGPKSKLFFSLIGQ